MARKILLVPLGSDTDAYYDLLLEKSDSSLEEALKDLPAFVADEPLSETERTRPVKNTRFDLENLENVSGDRALYLPMPVDATLAQPGRGESPESSPTGIAEPTDLGEATALEVSATHPEEVTERAAVAIAYREDIRKLATFLRSRLSVLVTCDKLVVPYLWKEILRQTRVPGETPSQDVVLEPVVLEMPNEGRDESPLGAVGGSNPLGALRDMIQELGPHQVLVIPNLDLLGGGGDRGLSRQGRDLTELVYSALDRLVLAFADPSLPVPEVLAARFAIRAEVRGLPRLVPSDVEGEEAVPLGVALVQEDEASLFEGFKAEELYKNIAGLNPIRLRDALTYAVQQARDRGHDAEENRAPVKLLHSEVTTFKAQNSELFAVPDVTFQSIGGYEEAKETLYRAIRLISGAGSLPDEALRHELIPRGFLLHGPPGTGKTLFAKAIANSMNATIRVVSGPEVTDMYVGESERKVRAIFADARRNAPSVIVFDEFDSIAARRTGRDDGGGRAGNALVAQILTEMDGFRPEVPILVIGTTNRLELIDEALMRPSRFQPISIGLPDRQARLRIAEIHSDHFKVPVDEQLLAVIADATNGLNGDDIRSLFRDACVGMYFEDPPIPADAHRLGFLVGSVRSRLDAQRGGRSEDAPRSTTEGRRLPSVGMSPLTRASAPEDTTEDDGSDGEAPEVDSEEPGT